VYDDSSDWQTVSSSIGTDERVDDLEEDEEVARVEWVRAQNEGEDIALVGWSSHDEVDKIGNRLFVARRGATDEELRRHLVANYTKGELTMLKNIDLQRTAITDVGLSMIACMCPGLCCINLCYTDVTDVGLALLYEACPILSATLLSKPNGGFRHLGSCPGKKSRRLPSWPQVGE
jgi:hypothetical protein